jgi:SAM-dependent methyltransferase
LLSNTETAFTNEQFLDAYPDGYGDHYWTIARSQMVLGEIRRIEKETGVKLSRILEIGCGRGFVVQFMRSAGRDCYGVELSKITDPLEEVEPYLFSGIDCVDLPADFRNEVDAILLLDVIEHVDDPVDFLSNIRRAYANAKWVVIHVPARMEIWSNFDSHYGHFRRYDPEMLKDHINRAGYSLLRSRYCFILQYLVMWILAQLAGGRRPLARGRPRPKFVHRAASYFFRAESRLLRRTGIYGSSLLGVAKV